MPPDREPAVIAFGDFFSVAREFDLLGHPIADNFGKPGANGHVPTAETCRKIRLLLVSGLPKKKIAEELGITVPTLNKHYFHSGRINVKHAREMALAEQRARTLLQLDQAAENGNVSAQKTLIGICDDEEMAMRAADAAGEPDKPKRQAASYRGKKAGRAEAAEEAIENDPLLNPELYH